jgi:dTDP-4-amino-4,6-dideoxygalactose transaminase
MKPAYLHHVVGGNFRLDALQAAVLSVKLKHLESWHAGRRANAEKYPAAFEEAGVPPDQVKLPTPGKGRHIYNQYTLRCADRDGLLKHLQARGIGCAIYYPLGLHLQPCFASLGHQEGDFPETERACREVLSIPIFPELTALEQREVAQAIAEFYKRG